ncbi:Adenosylmethionine-8-amino-7-oxononanoate aminotransferase [Pseudooceanicola nitratireducens]|jgi:adenosylmethionine-8-amino-7-oxononanoate aminotransferase|uniref:Adenosylmethionine-8-amino-7-oxononanoate aminotransferase n=1 Tax=Pseudooceanicola nitratireducens TaxID=517719 RepID=A0A1I1MXS8_9RHOB|nr:aspartate aminotransferase family protein [Pseudooceanicola nitratireducens]SEI78421.1 Adenosylmethionine-8-amino-7-oxononanoate aminotransferase [Pseudooceanicola nitratireducens]SFC90197.1 Adenosylmethionine-8-amino-7-oxononanoate aminotransferase [Pseudooceanicola nitratireducens]
MSHVFPRHTASHPPIAERGNGIYLFDREGKKYLDGSGGAAVSCLGHSDQDVIAAIKAQVDTLAFAHTGFFTSGPAESLADRLIAHAPAGIDRVYLVSGGSEAVESALKLARQYMIETGQPGRSRFIARKQSYHGNTLGALGTGGNMWRRAPFDPVMVSASHIDPCYDYRLRAEGESEAEYGLRAANLLEEELLRVGPETVIGFLAEPVVGATAGALPAVQGYFKRIREICDQYGILLILDEVMCGMGRTGTLFACEQDGISPDIVTIAKGLGAGYQPIGAMLCSGAIYDAVRDGSGFFQHGHTYVGHPTACAAADVVVTKLTEGGLVDRSARMGAALAQALADRFGDHPNVGDIRGRGMFRGIELVADRDTKAPFDPDLGVAAKLKKAAFANGLICYPMGGTIDGRLGDHILLAPPFIITDDQIAELVDKLSTAMDQVL